MRPGSVRNSGCAAPNFWRFCRMDKTNMVVSKNRPCEKKILRQGLFSGLVVSNTFLRVCLMCCVLVCLDDFSPAISYFIISWTTLFGFPCHPFSELVHTYAL